MSEPTPPGHWRRGGIISLATCALVAVGTAAAALAGWHGSPAASSRDAGSSGVTRTASPVRSSKTLPPITAPPTTTTTTTTLPAPGPGFVAGRVTAIGDSVLIDYQGALQSDIPGVLVTASVGRQWGEGEAIVLYLKSIGALGAKVIVALGTNGPITDADFDAMMAELGGASRVVFVNVHVDRPWQEQNNAVISRGVTRYPNAVMADWASLAAQNPQWLGGDGTHIALIDGPGAQALAGLVATTLANG
jgi:hypothetical protein